MAQDDVVSLFTELAALPSPPGEEREVADRVAAYMRDLGLEVSEDDAGERIGSTAGNLYARVEATDGGTPLFFCAHLDTVPPEAGIEPVLEDGVIRNAAGTILGADNKAAVAVMLEATRRLLSENRQHGGVELLFTPKEEVGLHGAAAFDHERLRARIGLRLRPGGSDRRSDPRRAVRALDGGEVPRAGGPRRDVSGGRPVGDRCGGESRGRLQARADRRGFDGERRR